MSELDRIKEAFNSKDIFNIINTIKISFNQLKYQVVECKNEIFGEITNQMISILIGGFILIIIGICDDIKPLKASYKLIGQILAGSIVVFYGNISLPTLGIFGLNVNFGLLGYPLALLFIVAIINAINLIDGLDGLASGTCSIFFLAVSINSISLIDVKTPSPVVAYLLKIM